MAFYKDIFKLASGSTLAQVINILSVPILTRLFAPAEFGTAALFIAIIAFIGPIMCLRYELGIMLPKSDNEAASVACLCMVILFVLTGIASIIVIGDRFVFHLILSKQIERYYYLIPLGLFLQGFTLVSSIWCSRRKSFGSLAIARISRTASSNPVKLVCGFQGLVTSRYLIIGELLGWSIQAIYLCQKILKLDKKIIIKKITSEKILHIARQYKKFPLFSTWGIFLNSLSRQAPVFFIAYFFGSRMVGFYAIARNILMIPSNMIAGAISRVFFQKAAQLYSDDIIPTKLLSQIVVNILIAGIFPCLFLVFFGKDILLIVLGARWGVTGLFTQIMAPMILVVFIGTAIGNLYHVYQKQEVAFYFNIIRGITIPVALLIGGKTGSVFTTILLFSLSEALVRIFGISWLLVKSEVDTKRLLYSTLRYLLFASLLILPIVFVRANISKSTWVLMGLLIIATMIYYGIFIERHVMFVRLGSKTS